MAKPLKSFLDTCSSSLLGYRILCWNGIKNIKKYSGYVIYILHIELVVAKLLSKRKGLAGSRVFFQKRVRFQNQLIFPESSCNSQIHSNGCALSSVLLWLLLPPLCAWALARTALAGP